MKRTRRLGRYHLTERIASGGMAEIYRAFTFSDDGTRRDVAIKQLLPAYTNDPQFVNMLIDEYKIVSSARHRNIAEVYELSHLDGNLIIAMEYVDGKDLRSTLRVSGKRNIRMKFDDAAYIIAKALDGLHEAHCATGRDGQSIGVVHRDFSPSNILLAYSGHVKLCDFGVAKATVNRSKTKTGIIKGKVNYMSPEQAFGRQLDARSDIFSAGSVLYELCTGRVPFKAASEVDLILAVRDAKPTPAQAINPNIPTALARIITTSMKRSRSARYQTASEFRDALYAFLRSESPDYRRIRLSRYMKKLWTEEIDTELRVLEDYIIDLEPAVEVDYGRNLIADALGPGATYQHFSPLPVVHQEQTVKEAPLHAQDTLPGPSDKTTPGDTVPSQQEGRETRILKGSS